MLVNFLNSAKNIYGPKNINTAPHNTLSPNMLSFKGDSFERSSVNGTESAKGAEAAENIWDETRIQKLYDEVYDDTIKYNPIASELNLEKPKTKMLGETRGYTQTNYSFQTNTLSFFMPIIKEDYFIAIVKDENGKEMGDYHILCESSMREQADNIHARHPNARVLAAKLTDKEKEVYIKTLTAHELRHWIQTHLAASTKDCSRIFKNAHLKNFEYFKDENEDYSIVEYLDNFIPKKIIPEDKKLKHSILENDTRYLSTKRHIVDYTLQLIERPYDKELYNASPMEADANHYAFEYLQLLKNRPEYSSLRKKFIDVLSADFYFQAEDGLELMKEAGFPGLYAKIR